MGSYSHDGAYNCPCNRCIERRKEKEEIKQRTQVWWIRFLKWLCKA